ncbi:hypothetical protein Cpir12675_003909 [Ceratocystis pirilliformis]|uniref:F-box domain-containing protein n=1 Tax=Ceratocystis pirilliformis TaxID=259994 RepID=A0ABR3YZT8_9PEZI
MQPEPPETIQQSLRITSSLQQHLSYQDGYRIAPHGLPSTDPSSGSGSSSSSSLGSSSELNAGSPFRENDRLGDSDELETAFQNYLCGINGRRSDKSANGSNHVSHSQLSRGARIAEYERLAASQPGKETKSSRIQGKEPELPVNPNAVKLDELPVEIMILIVSHLDAESQASIVLVSRRFNDFMSAHHVWRLGFSRFFPAGQSLMRFSQARARNAENAQSIIPHFARITALATWRTEYMLRTRLLRNFLRGRPGGGAHSIGSSSRSRGSNKKSNAVLTFNTKLPWLVTHLHAVFGDRNKGPRSIHGVRNMGVSSMGELDTGKVEADGVDDHFMASQAEIIFPMMTLYGLGEDYAAVPNVMDVSEPFGFIAGEGCPGGRPFYRSRIERRTCYLWTGVNDTQEHPAEIPRIPHSTEGISATWMAKKTEILSSTEAMIGMVTGSTLGIVTTYSVGGSSLATGVHFSRGEMTARWSVCPGVPIIGLKIDDNYSLQRKSAARVWAVVLNALGEVYYLKQGPTPKSDYAKHLVVANKWCSGLSSKWHLIEETRRVARSSPLGTQPEEFEETPPPNLDMSAPQANRILAARKIETFLSHRPLYFRHRFLGWDMRRRLEVDFANEDANRRGETVLVIDCGHGPDQQRPAVTRYVRSCAAASGLFAPITTGTFQPMGVSEADCWGQTEFAVRDFCQTKITASAIDASKYAVTTFAEDVNAAINGAAPGYPDGFTPQSPNDIPGYRGRYIAVGTDVGKVIVWDIRDSQADVVAPVRIIQTHSPEITSVALNALYLVHGGSDGLVQAWDPLASILEPLRTINSKTNGQVPRNMAALNPTRPFEEYSHVGAIYLDPDPSALRGLVSFGAMVRFWTYSSPKKLSRHRRRRAGGDFHGRPLTRRGHNITSYIAAEKAEICREEQRRTREEEYLRQRFGVGAFGDLNEEEALEYAQMISQDSFVNDEQRRNVSASAMESPITNSSSNTASSLDSHTLVAEATAGSSGQNQRGDSSTKAIADRSHGDAEAEFQLQIERALRLSLLEASGEAGSSSPSNTPSSIRLTPPSAAHKDSRPSTENPSRDFGGHSPLNPPPKNSYTAPITYKAKTPNKKGRTKDQQPSLQACHPSPDLGPDLDFGSRSRGRVTPMSQEEADLELALRLSMQPEPVISACSDGEDWPDLKGSVDKGKGRI